VQRHHLLSAAVLGWLAIIAWGTSGSYGPSEAEEEDASCLVLKGDLCKRSRGNRLR